MLPGKVRIAMSENNEPSLLGRCMPDFYGLIPGKVAQKIGIRMYFQSIPLKTAYGGIQQANFVDEDGLYDTILDNASLKLKSSANGCVTSEVLPCIRKTGATSLPKWTTLQKKSWHRALLWHKKR